jgi:hypothetical protein
MTEILDDENKQRRRHDCLSVNAVLWIRIWIRIDLALQDLELIQEQRNLQKCRNFYDLHKIFFHVKIQLLMIAKSSDQDPYPPGSALV